MKPWGWTEWIAWAGMVVPLAGLTWAAIFYVLTKRAELKQQRFEKFFKVMDYVGSSGSIASKMAGFYELRKYPEYRDVIVRLCEKAEVEGTAADMLRDEMQLTAEYTRKVRNA